jgi:hypothetical protein
MALKIPGTNITIKAPDPIIPNTGDRRESGTGGGRDLSTIKDRSRAAGEATGGAYVYKGKGRANKGEYRVNLSSAVRAEAEALGVDLPSRGYRGNRSSVTADAQRFNAALEAARSEQAEADAAATDTTGTTDTTDATDAFDIDVGDGETVEAADPADFNINAEAVDPIDADNTAITFDQVVTGSGDAADDSSTNTLMTGTFDDDYVAGTEAVASALSEGVGAADAVQGTSIDTGQTSAISGIVDQALALDNSTGAAEDEAIGDYTSGTRGTIMTSPQGLLTDESDVFSAANLEDDPFLRPNRSLGGGLLY